ncbi:MAG TPA: ion channel [Actinomycetes bacterium]|nr:ion channel [Actinomycetes bacterium]
MSTPQPERAEPAPFAARRRRSLGERLRGPDSYGLLFLLILVSLLLTGVVGDQRWGRVFVTLSSGATALFAFWTSRPSRRVLRLATIVVVLSLIGGVLAAVGGSGTGLEGLSRGEIALLTAASPVVIARRLVHHPRVQGSTILGALCIYLLFGLSFAYLFSTVGAVSGPFFAGTQGATLVEYLYFSFTSLTTVGYGDFVARTDLGRMLAVSEALTGQLYLVTVVALLVGNVGRGRRIRPPPEDP